MEMVIEKTFTPKADLHSNYGGEFIALTVVGCGGTGSRLIPLLAQHVMNHNKAVDIGLMNLKIKKKMSLNLIDLSENPEDMLEERNLRRQSFYQFDVGLPKAQALARRYSALYGIEIKYSDNGFKTIPSEQIQFVFDCTDNVTVRRLIDKSINQSYYRNIFLISCGNEDTFGQIFLKHRKRTYDKCDIFKFIQTFKEIKKSSDDRVERVLEQLELPSFVESIPFYKDSPALSCDQMLLVDDQSMPINNLMGTLAFNAFYEIVAYNHVPYIRVNGNIQNQFHTVYYTRSNVLNLLSGSLIGNIPDKVETCATLITKMYKHTTYPDYRHFKNLVAELYKENEYGDLPDLLRDL